MPRKKKDPIVRKVKLATFIGRLGDQIFTVDFTKQDGKPRTMNARLKVRTKTTPAVRFNKDGSIRKAPAANGVHTPSIKVYDMQKLAYRQINLETVTGIRANGKTYKVI